MTLLRIVAMKGGVSAETIAGCVGADATAVREALDGFTGRGLVKMTPMGYRITPSGRERCTELVTTERRSADQGAVAGVYGKFREHNRELKAVITDWQTRGADEPNDHSDAEYDRRVIERLLAVHQAVVPLVDQIAGLAPDSAITDGGWTAPPRRWSRATTRSCRVRSWTAITPSGSNCTKTSSGSRG